MDVARDLLDRQILTPDGRPCGRVDDVVLDHETATIAAILTGPGIVLAQLGRAVAPLRRIARLRRAFIVEWPQIADIDQTGVKLIASPTRSTAATFGAASYDAFARTPIRDDDGTSYHILDARCSFEPSERSHIRGLLIARHTLWVTLGLKRHDADVLPRARAADVRFASWHEIARDRDELRLRGRFDGLPRAEATPDPGPPPGAAA